MYRVRSDYNLVFFGCALICNLASMFTKVHPHWLYHDIASKNPLVGRGLFRDFFLYMGWVSNSLMCALLCGYYYN
jgi:hypothetical protein